MSWCEANGVDYVFGLGGNDVLDRKVAAAADDVRVRWAEGEHPVVRRYAETRYGAASWKCTDAPTPPDQPDNIQRPPATVLKTR